MTEYKLVEGNKLLAEIKKQNILIETLNNSYMNFIMGKDEINVEILYCIEKDLNKIIVEYATNKLNKLQEEFDNL